MDFNNAQFAHSMAGVETMNDDISTDVVQDPDLKKAQKAWSACMAKNGYTAPDPDNLALQQETALGLRVRPRRPEPVPVPVRRRRTRPRSRRRWPTRTAPT